MADIQVKRSGDRARVELGGELTVQHAQKMKGALIDALRSAGTVEIVIGEIAGVDSSFPQLLCSAHRTSADLHKQLVITGADQDRFADLLRRAGFTRHTGCRESTRSTCLWLHGPVSG